MFAAEHPRPVRFARLRCQFRPPEGLALTNLREVPGPATHLGYLDGWRGLAITFLLVGHFFPVPGINLGSVGVSLFFVLSGYLMGHLLFIRQTPLAVFYRRRIARIAPSLVFFIACIVAFRFATHGRIDWSETFAALFLVNNYVHAEPGASLMPFGHIWSLSVEEHSYILLSVVAVAARRHVIDPRWFIGCLLCCFTAAGIWYWAHYSGQELQFDKLPRSEVAAFGIFASALLLIVLSGRRPARYPLLVCPALLAAGILLNWWSVPSPIRTACGVGVLALTVNLLPNAPQLLKHILGFRPLRMMGIWSFSIYLWQQPFYLGTHGDAPLARFAGLVMGVACGVCFYYTLENPMRQYLNRVWGNPVAATSLAGAGRGR